MEGSTFQFQEFPQLQTGQKAVLRDAKDTSSPTSPTSTCSGFFGSGEAFVDSEPEWTDEEDLGRPVQLVIGTNTSLEVRCEDGSKPSEDVYSKLLFVHIPTTRWWKARDMLLLEAAWGPAGLHYLHPLWSKDTDITVQRLPSRCQLTELQQYFRRLAPNMPESVTITLPRHPGRARCCKGFAFVSYHPNLRATVAALWRQRLPSRARGELFQIFPACLQEYMTVAELDGPPPVWLTGTASAGDV